MHLLPLAALRRDREHYLPFRDNLSENLILYIANYSYIILLCH